MGILFAFIAVIIYYTFIGDTIGQYDAKSIWTGVVFAFFPLFILPAIVYFLVESAIEVFKNKSGVDKNNIGAVIQQSIASSNTQSLSPDAVLYLVRNNQNSRYRSPDESAFFYTNNDRLQYTKAISRKDQDFYKQNGANRYTPTISTSLSRSGLELSIKYPSRERNGENVERRITAYGLGRYGKRHYIIAYCHSRNERRTFALGSFRGCIDLSTGQYIASVKSHILKFNPVITDLTDEFKNIRNDQ